MLEIVTFWAPIRPNIETSVETLEALFPLTAEVGVLDLAPVFLAVTGGVLVVTRVTQVDFAGADCAALRAVEIRCGSCMARLDVLTSELVLTEKWTLDVFPEDEAETGEEVLEPLPLGDLDGPGFDPLVSALASA